MCGKPLLQRLEPPAGAADPSGKRRPVECNAMPLKDLRLAVQRRVVAVLGDQHLGQQAGCRQTLGHRTFGRRRLLDGATRPTAILGPANAQHAQRCWHPIEHLAHRLADGVQCPAAAGARYSVDVVQDVLARQVVGQMATRSTRLARRLGLLGG